MNDELRSPASATSGATSAGRTAGPGGSKVAGAALSRRAYARPSLVELGSVRDLTRGASNGNSKDGQGARRFV